MNDGSPTRIDPATGNPSAPDITFVDSKWANKCEWSVGENLADSDHLPIHIKVNSTVATAKPSQRKPKWKSNVDWSKFTQEVEDNIAKVTASMPMKEKVDTFNSVLIQAAKKHVGKVKPGGRRKPCITPPVRAAIRRRNRLRKDIQNKKDEWKEAALEVKNLKREAKQQAWKDYLEDAINEKEDSKIFKIIRSLNGSPDSNNTNEALVIRNGAGKTKTITTNIRKAQ